MHAAEEGGRGGKTPRIPRGRRPWFVGGPSPSSVSGQWLVVVWCGRERTGVDAHDAAHLASVLPSVWMGSGWAVGGRWMHGRCTIRGRRKDAQDCFTTPANQAAALGINGNGRRWKLRKAATSRVSLAELMGAIAAHRLASGGGEGRALSQKRHKTLAASTTDHTLHSAACSAAQHSTAQRSGQLCRGALWRGVVLATAKTNRSRYGGTMQSTHPTSSKHPSDRLLPNTMHE